jgi:6-pyruvoyltetrahydropterin/6-carboxytetrahydropterin synthase
MYTIYKVTTFEAAHQLKGHFSCGKLHGHSYKAEIWLSAYELDDEFGFVLDFHEIKNYFKQFDHSNQVLTISAEKIAENACYHFIELLQEKFPNTTSSAKVRIWETRTGYAEYERIYESN